MVYIICYHKEEFLLKQGGENMVLEIYALIAILTATVMYTMLDIVPKFRHHKTFFQALKEGIEQERPDVGKIKIYFIYLGTIAIFSLVWFISIPASIIKILKN